MLVYYYIMVGSSACILLYNAKLWYVWSVNVFNTFPGKSFIFTFLEGDLQSCRQVLNIPNSAFCEGRE